MSNWNKGPVGAAKPQPKKTPSAVRGIVAGAVVCAVAFAVCFYLFSGGDAKPKAKAEKKAGVIKEVKPAVVSKAMPVETLATTNETSAKSQEPQKKYAEAKPRRAPRGSLRTMEENYRPGRRTTPLFRHTIECDLATFARPGEPAPPVPLPPNIDKDIVAILIDPIEIEENDTPEEIETKQIVAGMKEEMKEYLKDGGTVQGFFDELQKRQDREVEYVGEARAAIYESLKTDKDPALALELWKRSNQFLQSKGICTVPLPRRLERYCEREGIDLTTVGASSANGNRTNTKGQSEHE